MTEQSAVVGRPSAVTRVGQGPGKEKPPAAGFDETTLTTQDQANEQGAAGSNGGSGEDDKTMKPRSGARPRAQRNCQNRNPPAPERPRSDRRCGEDDCGQQSTAREQQTTHGIKRPNNCIS